LAHDVFISYTIADKAAADAPSIVEAIGAAKLVVMILSAAANASPNVLDEA